MRKLLAHLFSPTGLLYIFVVIAQFAHAIYTATGAWEPNPTFSFIYAMGFLWIIGWWLITDSRRRGISWVYDLGLFLYIAWPILITYYLIKTRRTKGLLVIFGFLVAYVGAWLLGFSVYLMLFPNATWLE